MNGIIENFTSAFIEKQRYLFYLEGLKITLIVSFFAIIVGLLIGVMIAVTKHLIAGNKKFVWLDKILGAYVTVIRGTPVILQILIIANFIFVSRDSNPVMAAVLAFGINSSAYVSEIIRGGINSIDRGQMEAGRSLGLTKWQTMRMIILPQAIKNIIPSLGNEFVVLIKETSIAGVIAVTDLTKAAQYIGTTTYNILPPLIIAAFMYLIIVMLLTKVIRLVERRLARSDSH